MKRIREEVANERGSALLLVMFAVVFLGLLFGGLFMAVQAGHHQAVAHKLQVQAEYDAQKMMDWALQFYYADDERKSFDALFEGEDHCFFDDRDDPDGDQEDTVCLVEESQADGTTVEVLVATGTETSPDGKKQTSTIKFALTGDPSDLPPTTDDGPPPVNGEPPYAGSACDNREKFFVRALSLGTDLDLTRAFHDTGRTSIDEEPDSVQIYGGLYLHNQGKILLPGDPTTETVTVPVNLNGYLYPEGGLQWAEHPNAAPPPYRLLGDYAEEHSSCAPNTFWHYYLTDLVTQISEEPQKVPVYKFTGNYVTGESVGKRKNQGEEFDRSFQETDETLSQVLQDRLPKIVIVQGNLILDSQPTTNGWLIVAPSMPGDSANIYLPDHFNWHHSGAITADGIGRYTADMYTEEWPDRYRLSIRLSEEQAKLYVQEQKD